jgi:hypothetical protein
MRMSWAIRCLFCFILALGFDSGTALADHTARYCTSCERDARGRIKRSTSVRRAFQREHPCPSTGLQTGHCPGYIKDHIRALKHGGTDTVDNMQWEPTTEAKSKDRIE